MLDNWRNPIVLSATSGEAAELRVGNIEALRYWRKNPWLRKNPLWLQHIHKRSPIVIAKVDFIAWGYIISERRVEKEGSRLKSPNRQLVDPTKTERTQIL